MTRINEETVNEEMRIDVQSGEACKATYERGMDIEQDIGECCHLGWTIIHVPEYVFSNIWEEHATSIFKASVEKGDMLVNHVSARLHSPDLHSYCH